MRILKNIRFGFATNSSSSHSLVYFKTPQHDDNIKYAMNENEFGWEMFRLDTLGEKLMYWLVGQMHSRGWTSWGEPVDVEDAMKELGPLVPEFSKEHFEFASSGYIDHQSVDTLTSIDDARDPHVVVIGGNDNGDEHYDTVNHLAKTGQIEKKDGFSYFYEWCD